MRTGTFFKYIFLSIISALAAGAGVVNAQNPGGQQDTTKLIYPFADEAVYEQQSQSPLFMNAPSNITSEVEYDPESNQYIMRRKVGDKNYRYPATYTFKEYRKYDMQKSLQSYWRERAKASGANQRNGLLPQIHIGGEAFDRIFGGNTIDIRPQGSAELIFGVLSNRRDDPSIDVRRRRTTNFDFQEKIQMNVMAKIGDKIEFQTNYNTESTFEFENKLKLKYEGKEDEIIQLIEAGDVTLPLNSTLITGSQSLFGIKTQLKFGRTTVTAVYSEQKSETSNITVQGGAQTAKFSIKADEYEENRHFFVAQKFREQYDDALAQLPIITSNINITKMEVWITNIGPAVEDNRNIVAFADLGEPQPYNPNITPGSALAYPDNNANGLIVSMDTAQVRDMNRVNDYLASPPFNFVSGEDFERVESARKLSQNEFTFNRQLGFISLNTTMNPNQVLAVSYQYQIIGDTTLYQVGEFSDQGVQGASNLIVKMLKGTSLNIQQDMWKLMMKNVYNIGAFQVNNDDFILNILFSGSENGVPTAFIMEGPENVAGKPLLQVFGFDRMDTQKNPPADGLFDFVDGAATTGGTINSSNGRIFFPALEPFGSFLRKQFEEGGQGQLADKFCYDSLYTLTKSEAQQYPEKNKFLMEGMYKSSSGSEISLNALNVPKGSVKVTAGGIPLTENVDYTVDYTLGRVRIINEGILNSGTPINISLESNSLFNIQTQRLAGAHVDYKINDDFNVGATILNLSERPLTQKTNFGDEPISNTIWGFDLNYRKESRFITKMVDALPGIETKAPSSVTVNGEFAHFIPGHSRAIGKSGTSYIDDFEGSESTIDMKNVGTWFLASTPQGQIEPNMFPESRPGAGLEYGFNRAKLAWYVIDPLFYELSGGLKPGNVSKDELSKNAVRRVPENELFTAKENPNNLPINLSLLNLAYYPNERGPYNFDVDPSTYSAGILPDGTLENPETRWAGIMRRIETSDFEATNVEYLEFWMMDPFADDVDNTNPGGRLYLNLGEVSEDILRDGRKSYENGLPTSDVVENVDTTIWGRVPRLQALVPNFDSEISSRPYQDVGYDGLNTADEQLFFSAEYLDKLAASYGQNSEAYLQAKRDPSGDDYHYFRGTDFDNNDLYGSILLRYKNYNGSEGNSPSDEQSPESYPTLSTTLPNVEDINRDNTLNTTERYYQYKVELRREFMEVGQNYIVDEKLVKPKLANGEDGEVKWYQFRIPVRDPNKVVGNMRDFRSIRFMRMFMKGFSQPVVLRFATLELVRGEWRRYRYDLLSSGEYVPNDENTSFEITSVNIEENERRDPINYMTPPGIDREINVGSTNLVKLNEQSLVMRVCNLQDGDARATYKTTDFDFRQFKQLKMFVHAEEMNPDDNLQTGDLTVFMRLGSDFTQNYYEYEVPVSFTEWGDNIAEAIWPESNEMNIQLDRLIEAKKNRNNSLHDGSSSISTTIPYIERDGKNKITILGVPNLGDVRAIMIGVRNPKRTNFNSNDDGDPKCAEVWVNELRLSEFDESSGWAATARVKTVLADLGDVSVSGSYSTPGFGSIEKKVNERQKETLSQFDIATNLQLGKFFPEEWGLRVPMHFDYSEGKSTPQYNPLEPDIKYKEQLNELDKSGKDSLKMRTQDFTQRKNLNFINVRKERVGASSKKPKIYDVENFDVSYSYAEVFHRNIDIESELEKNYRGGLGYNFTTQPKAVRPFKNTKWLKSKSFKIIKDFNFYYVPKLISFRTDMNRESSERQLRDKSNANVPLRPTEIRNWSWGRNYDLKYDLTQGLKLEFKATANAFIYETPGVADPNDPFYDSTARTFDVGRQILDFGKMDLYNQNFTANYAIPINKIPLFNWVNATAKYSAAYRWKASPQSLQERFGNTIENSNTKQLNTNLKFTNLYNKIGYLKKLNDSRKRRGRSGTAPRRGAVKKPDPEVADTTETKPKINYAKLVLDNSLKILMSVRDGSFTYSESNGMSLPGFTPQPDYLGNNFAGGNAAPGLGFVFGEQNHDFPIEAARNGWISTDSLLNQPFAFKWSKTITYRVKAEPIKDLRIEINGDRNESRNHQEYFRFDLDTDSLEIYSPVDRGTYSTSYWMMGSAFEKVGDDNASATFDEMKGMRPEIANRLASANPDWNGNYFLDTLSGQMYPVGYGPNSQEVLLHSFLTAYSGKSANQATMEAFPKIPMPNYRITYTGLTNLEPVKKWFKNFNISSGYRSTYAVGSYVTNVEYDTRYNHPTKLNSAKDYIPEFRIDVVTLTEQFSPLINLDMTFHNSLMAKFELKKSRNLSMSFVNNQMTEVRSDELIVGAGYRIKDVEFTLASMGGGGKKNRMKSDLNLKGDFSIRNNRTILRRIEDGTDQVSTGSKVMSINFSADYTVNQNFNVRLFFDKIITNPYVSSQFPNSTTKAGVSMRFTLAQ